MELIRISKRDTCHQGEWSLQCLPFNLPILPRQNGWVKMIVFETEAYFFRSLGHVARGGEESEKNLC